MKSAQFVRALRLPFVSASALPFILGSLISKGGFDLLPFLLGFIAAVSVHLSANLMNDYADSNSGVDWKDKRFFGFFGGSKLIQEGIVPAAFYRKTSILFFIIAAVCVFLLSLIMRSTLPAVFLFGILALAWSYSVKPLALSYRRAGEAVIFLLFGPALVMGGYFIQTGIFPAKVSFLLSLPAGFLVTAILFANEVPDYPDDRACGKNTWVSVVGQKNAYLVYLFLIAAALLSVFLSIKTGYLSVCSLAAVIILFPSLKAAVILKEYYDNKEKLRISSKLTIASHTLLNVILILGLLICKK